MRSTLVFLTATVAGIGALTLAACSDDAPTAARPNSAAMAAPHAMATAVRISENSASLTLPPEEFNSEPLGRGRFIEEVNVLFRIKGANATEVVQAGAPLDMVMSRITIPPNRSLPWHSHPGPALVTVVSGALTFVDGETCKQETFGDDLSAPRPSFIDRGQGHVHVAYNKGTVPVVLAVTYLIPSSATSALIRVPNPGC